ncbi:MAG: modification methylase [Planctomycetes bacterium RBG_13_60_9]|nr:MAG: modification methylase [Planctomycetes bacterium RBG_13_60_9]
MASDRQKRNRSACSVALVRPDSPVSLDRISQLNAEFEQSYESRFVLQSELTRSLVSFQANKRRPAYRWFKYKEAFSAGLIEFLLNKYGVTSGLLLDPFAGIGTAMFAASAIGIRAEGIELLPIGRAVIATKRLIEEEITPADIARIAWWSAERPWEKSPDTYPITELRITRGAYPPATADAMGRYLSAIQKENDRVRRVLLFALLCVLEAISYTRKDGQYLRWDHRSGRCQGKKPFDKGNIAGFTEAICGKLTEILADLGGRELPENLFAQANGPSDVVLHEGSCLDVLPGLATETYDCIFTSPPYCNRYDYTRTYALELAVLGVDEAGLLKLRQDMLSCTVENRAKNVVAMNPRWQSAIDAADEQPLLQSILTYLDEQRRIGALNNSGIARMVRGYFYEMACIIAECARVLRRGAPLIMVNDNVRYAGASISVDIILSEVARRLGFHVESILVLPNGKGNSSQQMGVHGREALRKCVYIWRRK